MKNYSIEKIGADYVVKVDDQSVMKFGSRRRAAQLIVDAQELLGEAPVATADLSLDDEDDPADCAQERAGRESTEGAC